MKNVRLVSRAKHKYWYSDRDNVVLQNTQHYNTLSMLYKNDTQKDNWRPTNCKIFKNCP